MIFPTTDTWAKWGITEDHHKFFLLRWEEIFSEETYDAWQIRTVNLQAILLEMLDAADTTASFQPFHPNIKLLIDEAIHLVKADPIITKHFPFTVGYLDQLNQCYESKVKQGNRHSIIELKRTINVLIEHITLYKQLLIKRITEILTGPSKDTSIELYSLIMAFGLVLRTEGYSIAYLKDSINILIDSSVPNFVDRFGNLILSFSSKELEYVCSFFVITTREKVELGESGITFYDTRPNPPLTEVESEFYDQDDDPYRVCIKIRALDPYSARAKAEKSVENLFAAYNFYQPNRHPRFKHKPALIVSEKGDQFCIEKDDSRLNYIRDSKKPAKSISSVMTLVGPNPEDDFAILTASLQYHRLAMSTATDEARLVNLWIALESLTRGDQGSVIDNLCKYLPASVGLEYVLQTIKNLAISMRKVWRQSADDELLKLFKYSDKFRLHQIDLLGILTANPTSEKVKKFNAIVEKNQLLRFRFFRLHNNMFKSPKILRKKIKRHQLYVEWQISRIYRARNYVMHSGFCPPRIRQLIQHLHSYYILVMHGLIHDLKYHKIWGIEHSFENRLTLNNLLIMSLENYQRYPISAEELLYPSRMLVKEDSPNKQPIWVIDQS